jgi:hypothetical protein
MKFLLILCFSFSLFATHHNEKKAEDFNEHKSKMLEQLKSAENPNQEDIACVEKAKNKKALKKCKKAMSSKKAEKKKEEPKPKAMNQETNQEGQPESAKY